MADPFPIVATSANLIKVLWRCGSYAKKIIESGGTIDDDIFDLDCEIHGLISVNESLKEAYHAEMLRVLPRTSLADIDRINTLWRNVGTLVKDCQKPAEELEELMADIIGRDSSTTSKLGDKLGGKLDNLKKTIRREKKDDDFKDIRMRLMNYQNSLQILLTALNLAYTRSSQESTDLSLGHLSDELQLIRFKLQSQIASLRPKLASTTGTSLLDAINSATAVASLISINKHFYIPQIVSSIFTGREQYLADLQQHFDVFGGSTNPTRIQKRFIIYGLGGSGKTQFCCKFAQHNRQNYWGIFCIDATSPETAESSFSRILKIAKIERVGTSKKRAAKDWLSSLERPWLLIVDNADDDTADLEDYFPDGERGCILVTTRDPGKRLYGTVGPKYYHFERMDTDEANHLLLSAACHPAPWNVSTIKSANSIADKLGFLPLALVQAGKAIMNGLCSLANYLEHYQRSWELIRYARKKPRYKLDETKYRSVYSSYEINLKRLEEQDDLEAHDAVELLKMFSFLHCEDIRIEFLITAAVNPRVEQELRDKDKEVEDRMKVFARPKTWGEYTKEMVFNMAEAATRERGQAMLPTVLRDIELLSAFQSRLRCALGKLARMSLITQHDTAAEVYSMHPLVHEWVRERPDMNTKQALWCQTAATALAQSILLPPHGSLEKEEYMRRILLLHIDHVRKCQIEIAAKIADNRKQRQWWKLPWLSPVKAEFGRRQAIESAKFSRVYQECGLWEQAEELQVKVKEFACRKLGLENPLAIGATLWLASTYSYQQRTNAAAELQSQVYEACLKSIGPDHPRTLKVMDILGSSRCTQGRFKESLELHEKAIAGMKKIKDLPNPEDLYIAMGNRGSMLWRYFRFDDARKVRTEVLEGLKKILGATHIQTLSAMEDLALSYIYCGEEWLDQAHDLMLEVLRQRETRYGKRHPFTLLAMCSLARVKSAMGQTAEAEKIFREGIPIAEQVLGENYIGALAGKAHFAHVLMKRKLYDEAEEVLVKVVEKKKYDLSARKDGDHPDRIYALWFLIQCYQLHGKTDRALEVLGELEEVIATIGGQGLGKLHPFAKRLTVKREELESYKTAEENNGSGNTTESSSTTVQL